MSETETSTEYRLVTGDYGDTGDVGLVAVEYTDYHDKTHWIVLPDGQIRKRYDYKILDQTTFETMLAFGMVPQLKVFKRPIARALSGVSEAVCFFWIISILLLLVDGLIVLVVEWFFHSGAMLLHTNIGNIVQHFFFWLFAGTGIATVICWLGHKRYNDYTKHDQVVREWELEQEEKKRESDGW